MEYRATYPQTPRHLKAALPDDGPATATAVLTFPVLDREGDFVRPDGGDWSGRTPLVDWWHKVPVGTGTVRMKAVTLDGTDYTLPVGTTKFFEKAADLKGLDLKGYPDRDCLDAAERVAEMVAGGAVNGVSLEFEPSGPLSHRPGSGAYWRIPEGRFHFERWLGRGWAHAPETAHVNPGALVLAKALPPAIAEIAASGEYRGRKLPAAVMKAFPQIQPRPAVVRGGYDPEAVMRRKAMPTDDENPLDDPYMDDPEAPGDDPAADASDPADDLPNEIKHSYDAAQGAHDLAEMLTANMKRIVDKSTRRQWAKCVGMLRKVADTLAGHGDSLHAGMGDVQGEADDADDGYEPDGDEGDDPDEPSDGDGDEEDEEDDDPEGKSKKPPFGKAFRPVRTGAGGVIVTKAGYVPHRVVRLKSSQLRDVPAKAPAAEPAADPEPDAETLAAVAELARVHRGLRKATREVKQLSGQK